MFGSGIIVRDEGLVVVTPGHVMDGVWFTESSAGLILCNSFVGLLVAAGLDLDPHEPYPTRFLPLAELRWMRESPTTQLLDAHRADIPVLGGQQVSGMFFENLSVDDQLRLKVVRKPREAPFTSFADFRDRLTATCASLIENGAGRQAVVALSGGYDSTAVAAVAAQVGCKSAVSLSSARTFPSGASVADDGRITARALGLRIQVADRLAYLHRSDLPEAEFLAGGMSGEDVPLSNFQDSIRHTILLTGYWAGQLWAKSHAYPPRHLHPGDLSGFSLTEFCLRNDVIHVPLACFGAAQSSDFRHFYADDDMLDYTLGGHYDRPVPRRLAEEGGVPRGSFAQSKRAASVMVQREPESLLAPATLAAIREFARVEGRTLMLGKRGPTPRWLRGLIRIATTLRLETVVGLLDDRRRSLVHFDPHDGAIVLRWAVEIVRPRYAVANASGQREES